MREITFLLRNEAQSLLNVKLTLIYFDKYIRESPLSDSGARYKKVWVRLYLPL